jgi:hypothetical protein
MQSSRFGLDPFYLAVTGGPATVGVTNGAGFTSAASVGGAL